MDVVEAFDKPKFCVGDGDDDDEEHLNLNGSHHLIKIHRNQLLVKKKKKMMMILYHYGFIRRGIQLHCQSRGYPMSTIPCVVR